MKSATGQTSRQLTRKTGGKSAPGSGKEMVADDRITLSRFDGVKQPSLLSTHAATKPKKARVEKAEIEKDRAEDAGAVEAKAEKTTLPLRGRTLNS
jgi:hypothetical protein